jgi:hypothetical protein
LREILGNVLRFPEQRRMQPNPFHNLEMLRKKKLGLIFPGSDGNEIGFLTGVVQNASRRGLVAASISAGLGRSSALSSG